jgi:hypothetical protein
MDTTQRERRATDPGIETGFGDFDEGTGPLHIVVVLAGNPKLLIIGPLVVGLAALGN